MKYIRTKGEIIDRQQLEDKYGCYEAHELIRDFDYDIINQADTIEELCDEFVVMRTYKVKEDDIFDYKGYEISKNYMRVYKKDFRYMLTKGVIGKGDVVYGAIWTDKGLIYVAKMNNKGELELL